jgi:hypothetical protein
MLFADQFRTLRLRYLSSNKLPSSSAFAPCLIVSKTPVLKEGSVLIATHVFNFCLQRLFQTFLGPKNIY